jgi:hypothetical protein
MAHAAHQQRNLLAGPTCRSSFLNQRRVAGRAPVHAMMCRHTGTLNTLLAAMLYTRKPGHTRSIRLMHSSSLTGNTP